MRARFVIVALAGTLLAACGASEASGGPEIQATEETGAASSVVEVTMPRSTTTSVAAGPAESVADHPEVTDDRVYLVGDSITESIASRYSGVVCDALTPLGWNVTVDARQGRTTGEAVQSLRANRSRVGEVVSTSAGSGRPTSRHMPATTSASRSCRRGCLLHTAGRTVVQIAA